MITEAWIRKESVWACMVTNPHLYGFVYAIGQIVDTTEYFQQYQCRWKDLNLHVKNTGT